MKSKIEKLILAALELKRCDSAICHRYSWNGIFYSDIDLWPGIAGVRSELLQLSLCLWKDVDLQILKQHRALLVKTEQTAKKIFVVKLVDLISDEVIKENNYRGTLPEAPNQFSEYWFLLLEDISIDEDEPGHFFRWVCEPCEIVEQEIT